MNIGWAHDHTLESYWGGAELTNERILGHVPDWGKVERVLPGNFPEDCDCYIVNNVRYFSWTEWQRMMEKPYIIFCHDPADMPQKWATGKIPELYNKAEAVVFLSPFHRRAFCDKWNLALRRTFLCPSAIDPTLFYAREHKYGNFYAGAFESHKGIANVVNWARDRGEVVDFYGGGSVEPIGEGIGLITSIPYDQMPDMLARYKRLVFLPNWIEAFGRVTAEAALSGCKLEVNHNVGALSWGWQTRQEWACGVGNAHKRFWAIIKQVWL